VKGKTGTAWGDPLEMVNEEKVRRLHRAATAWLVRNPACAELDVRFEAVAVRPGGLERVPL